MYRVTNDSRINVLKLIARVQSRVAIGSTRVAIGYAREVIVYDRVDIEWGRVLSGRKPE